MFSNHWKIFARAVAGISLMLLLPAAVQAYECSMLDVGIGKEGGNVVVSFKGIDNDRDAIAGLLGRVLEVDPGLVCNLCVDADVTMEELAENVEWIRGIGFKGFVILGYSQDGLAVRMVVGECMTFSDVDDALVDAKIPEELPIETGSPPEEGE